MREHLPSGCALVKVLELEVLETIVKEVLSRSMPIVTMAADDPLDLHDQIAAEVSQLWENLDPGQIAYILKQSAEGEWQDPETLEYFYGLSVEEIVLDCVDGFLMDTVEDIMQECMGPGEDCGYFISIRTFDDEVQEEQLREMQADMEAPAASFNYFVPEDDEDDEPEEVEVTKMLSDSSWFQRGLIKGYVMEVTGENAAIYLEDNGQEKLVIPKILQLLHKAKKATPGKWYEHKPGWRYRLAKEPVADTV